MLRHQLGISDGGPGVLPLGRVAGAVPQGSAGHGVLPSVGADSAAVRQYGAHSPLVNCKKNIWSRAIAPPVGMEVGIGSGARPQCPEWCKGYNVLDALAVHLPVMLLRGLEAN